MTLDIGALAPQVASMGKSLQGSSETIAQKITQAVGLLHSRADDYQSIETLVKLRRPPWPVAGLVEPLDSIYSRPTPITDYIVAATDGSQIEPDRHGTVLCHLINIGWACIRYGDRPKATLASQPELCFDAQDLYLLANGRRVLISGQILDIKRNVEEMERLAKLADKTEKDIPMVALADGVLVLRAMEGWRIQEEFRSNYLPRFEASLARFQALGVPVAAYISRPRSYELVSALRVATCPFPSGTCAERCGNNIGEEPCGALSGILDRMVMEGLPMDIGQRSARFRASSSAEGTPSYFFYVNVGGETARVETPTWVALRPELLDLVHAVVLDQCARGNGYPRVLTEAHERAVLTTGDRQLFERLVEATVARYKLPERTSAKERSKRVRGI